MTNDIYELPEGLQEWCLTDTGFLKHLRACVERCSRTRWKALRIHLGDTAPPGSVAFKPSTVRLTHHFCASYVSRSSSKWSVGSMHVDLGHYTDREPEDFGGNNYYRVGFRSYFSAPSRLALLQLVKGCFQTYSYSEDSLRELKLKWKTLTSYFEEKYSKAWLASALLKIGDL